MNESNFEGIWYRWSCFSCGAVHEEEDDIRGQEVECPECGEKSVVVGST